jgi:phage gp29-like protein
MENMWDIKKVMESQGNMHNMVEVQANSESRSLTSTPTRSLGLPYLQIDVQDASDL